MLSCRWLAAWLWAGFWHVSWEKQLCLPLLHYSTVSFTERSILCLQPVLFGVMMKNRWDAILISTTIMSLCLVGMIPGSLRFASTWKDLYIYDLPDRGIQNFLMPVGFYSLGLELIGLIVLWTWFRKKERWAWFIMLIILLFLIFPPFVLTLIVKAYKLRLGIAVWSDR